MSNSITSQFTPAFLGKDPTLSAFANDMLVEVVDISAVKEPDRQVRPVLKRATAAAKAMLEQWGQFIPLAVGDDGTIIAGYEFLIAARELGWQTIKVLRLSNLSREHARVLSIALARLPELSKWDEEILRLEFTDLLSVDLGFDLHDLVAFTIGEMDVVLEHVGDDGKLNPLDDIPEATVAGETVTRLDDIWLLGPHRIACGNSLEGETYHSLMGENITRMVLADCPYGIPIKGHASGLGKKKHDDFAMGVGERTFAEFVVFLKTWLMLSTDYLIDGGLCFGFMDRRHLEEFHIAGREAGLGLFDVAVWNKMSGAMGSFYRSQHELCVIFKKGKVPHLNNVELGKHGRYRTNVWDHRGLSSFGHGREEALNSHPTVKPVNLLAEAIKDCTKRGDIVLDPFLGSGSMIIAAQKTGRVGYGIELEPKYVEVSLRRWERMSGKEAIHEATGYTFAQLRCRRLRQAVVPASPDTTGADIPAQ